MTVPEFLAAARHYARQIAGAFLAAAAVALVVTVLLPRSYEAEVKLLVGNLLDDVPEYEDILIAQRLSVTYTQLLETRSFAASVARDPSVSLSVDELLANVEAATPLESAVITVSARAGDPVVAAAVANAYGRSLVEMAAQAQPDPDQAWASRVTLVEDAVPPAEDANPPLPLVGLVAGALGALLALIVVAARAAGALASGRNERSPAAA